MKSSGGAPAFACYGAQAVPAAKVKLTAKRNWTPSPVGCCDLLDDGHSLSGLWGWDVGGRQYFPMMFNHVSHVFIVSSPFCLNDKADSVRFWFPRRIPNLIWAIISA